MDFIKNAPFKVIINLFAFIFISSSFANVPTLSSDKVLSYTGESGVIETVTLSLSDDNTELVLKIQNSSGLNSYNYSLESVVQFRFISKEHMDNITKSADLDIYIEIIHKYSTVGKIQEMEAMFNLVKYDYLTHYSVQNGDWSDPATWGGEDNVPLTGARILIKSGHTVTVDDKLSENYKTIRVDGTLRFAPDRDTSLKTNTLIVSNKGLNGLEGKFEMGTESNPIQKGVKARLIIDKMFDFETTDSSSPDYDPHKLGLGMIAHGKVEIYGAKKTGRAQFNGTPAGVSSITLDKVPEDWEVGDHIVIAGVQNDALGDEARNILGIFGNSISFSTPLTKNHTTPTHTKSGLTLKVHVINTTRNASIETANGLNRVKKIGEEFSGRGHVMFMHTNNATVHYAGFYHLGRTNKLGLMKNVNQTEEGIIISPAQNPIARYSIHFHRAGNSDQMGIVKGCAVVNSPGWGYVNHRSSVVIENNVAYDVNGASFVAEAGDEKGTFKNNVSIRNIGNGKENFVAKLSFVKTEEKAFFNVSNFGSAGDGFWMQSRLVSLENNVASGFKGNGFMMWNEFIDGIATDDNEPPELQKSIFYKNNVSYGGDVGQNLGFLSKPEDGGKNKIVDFVSYNVRLGFKKKYAHDVSVENVVLIGDLNHPKGDASKSHSNGSSFLFLNAHVEGFVGGLDFEHRNGKAGILEGGYFNNILNAKVNIRHDRTQKVLFNKDMQFGTLSTAAITNVASDSIPGFDGNQYNFYGYLDKPSKDDDGFVDNSPPDGAGVVSNMVIQQPNGTYQKALLETEQHKDYIPWTAANEDINANWHDKTNEQLQNLIDANPNDSTYVGSVLSGEYYLAADVETPTPIEKYFNIVLGPENPDFTFINMYINDSIPDLKLKIGTSVVLDLTDVVFDPNQFGVNYFVLSNSNTAIATASIIDKSLTLNALQLGETTFEIDGKNANRPYKRIIDTFTLTVIPNDIPLVATDDEVVVAFNTTKLIDVLENDIWAEEFDISIISSTQGTNGATISIESDNTISYIPATDFSGNDSFTYTIKDIYDTEVTATVNVIVNSIAPNFEISVEEGQSIDLDVVYTIDSSTNGNDGDTSFSNTILTYSQTNTAHDGSDQFTYTIGSNTGTVTVNILPEIFIEEVFVGPEGLFYDGFESESFATENWTTTNNTEIVAAADYQGDFGARIKRGGSIQVEFSTIGHHSIIASYYRETQLNQHVINPVTGETVTGNYFDALWSIDGINWFPLEPRVEESQDWRFVYLELPEIANNQESVYLLFDVYSFHLSERVMIDEVLVTGIPFTAEGLPEPEITVMNQENNSTLIFDGNVGDDVVKTILLTNEGVGDLNLENYQISGVDYSILTTNLPDLLKTGNTASIQLKVNSLTETAKTGTFTFSSNDNDETVYTINLITKKTAILGINQNTLNKELVVYPNPSKGVINFEGEEVNDIDRIIIFDLVGQIIQNVKITNATELNDFRLNTIENGIYFIQIYANLNPIGIKKIVVNKRN